MEIDLPVRGLEPLRPLGAYLVIYFLILFLFRLFIWPAIEALRRGRLAGELLDSLLRLVLRLIIFASGIAALLWALSVIGITVEFSGAVEDLPWFVFPVPGLGELQISVVLLLFSGLTYLIIRPILAYVRRRKAKG